MKLQHDPLISIDLTKSLPNLKSSLSGQTRHNFRRNRAAEEFSLKACALMAAWIIGFVLFLSIAIIIWA